MGEKPHIRYSAVSTQDDLRERYLPNRSSPTSQDLRYQYELQEEIPWKSIALALFLLAFGSVFLIISHLIFVEHMGGDSSQAYGFLVLGILLFLPGFYETRIAYYSWRGYKGFKFSGIPVY